jgi:ATP synthase protein I
MSEKPPPEGLEDFGARLKRMRAEAQPPQRKRATDEPTSGMGMAFSISAHMVAGVGVGAFVGYWLDRWLDTSPWLLILLFFLGSAAGMLNVYRTVTGIDMAMGYRPKADDKKKSSKSGTKSPDHRAED